MSRKLSTFVIVIMGYVAAGSNPVLAQDTRQPRPQANPLQVQNLSPQLNNLLQMWSQQSAQVSKLHGTHRRFVYDTVFQVEKRAMGAFYYEAPGKGRIDLKPVEIGKNEVALRKDKNGKPFKLQGDRAERWICNGQDIMQVNDQTKQIDIFPIPKENQGQNIMDGPMPFLFGMPPAKAKRRYTMKLLSEDEKQAVIQVFPKLQLDAANWKEAKVIIDKKLWLPYAVQLIDPTGNLETVYRFYDFKINNQANPGLIQKIFVGDTNPFNPQLKGYASKFHNPPAPPGKPGEFVPSVAGFGWKDAKTLLERSGYQVKIFTGHKAPESKFTHVVYDQKPAAKSPLSKGQPVVLTIYAEALKKTAEAPKVPTVPAVLGMYWKDAEPILKKAGYKVKYVPGDVAPSKEKLFTIYQQTPDAGKAMSPGAEVVLTVYNQKK